MTKNSTLCSNSGLGSQGKENQAVQNREATVAALVVPVSAEATINQHWEKVNAFCQSVTSPTHAPAFIKVSLPTCKMAMLRNYPVHFHSGPTTIDLLKQQPRGCLLKTQIYSCHTLLCSNLVGSYCTEDETGKL